MSDQESLRFNETDQNTGPVECLGRTFESDESRRAHYLALLAEKLKDSDFRKTPGFPNGADEDILRLSDPPYYTACPNPFLDELVGSWTALRGEGDEHCNAPYSSDISTGKGDRSYYIHGYHTKVPPSAISQLIGHYARAGDVVLDCFSGSGMTGLASTIKRDPDVGVVLSDLSSSAGFISYFHSLFRPSPRQQKLVAEVFSSASSKFAEDYLTDHVGWSASGEAPVSRSNPAPKGRTQQGEVVYVVWSEVIRCPDCLTENSLWNACVDLAQNAVAVDFPCRGCDALLTKTIKGAKKRGSSIVESVDETVFDQALRTNVKRVRRVPALISYDYNGKRYEKYPDEGDLTCLQKADSASIHDWFPTDEIPVGDESWRLRRSGISHVHHLYPARTLAALAFMAGRLRSEPGLIGFITSILTRCSWQNRYIAHSGDRERSFRSIVNTRFGDRERSGATLDLG